jgi:hypothetical protein
VIHEVRLECKPTEKEESVRAREKGRERLQSRDSSGAQGSDIGPPRRDAVVMHTLVKPCISTTKTRNNEGRKLIVL